MMLSEETSAVRPPKQTRFNGAKLVWMLKGSPLTVTGAVIIVLMLLMMIFSPWLATHDPNAIDLTARLLPPSAAHWFGTDEVGRDLFSRVLVGSQQSILAGLVVVAIAGMMGSLLGCLSGVLGGRADAIIAWRTRRRDYHAHHGHYAVDSFAGADNGTGSRSRAEFV